MTQTAFEVVREKYKKAQAEKIKEMGREKKELTNPDEFKDRFGSVSDMPPREEKRRTLQEASKTIRLREELRDMVKQTQANEHEA
jgi:hypothetical protein